MTVDKMSLELPLRTEEPGQASNGAPPGADAEAPPRPKETPAPPADAPKLEAGRHVRYWLRCLRTLLPTPYMGSDSIQSTLGFFVVAALGLLQGGDVAVTAHLRPEEVENTRKWVLSLQRPSGGFVGNANLILPLHKSGDPDEPRPSATDGKSGNLAGTFFALLLLAQIATELEPDSDQDLESEPKAESKSEQAAESREKDQEDAEELQTANDFCQRVSGLHDAIYKPDRQDASELWDSGGIINMAWVSMLRQQLNGMMSQECSPDARTVMDGAREKLDRLMEHAGWNGELPENLGSSIVPGPARDVANSTRAKQAVAYRLASLDNNNDDGFFNQCQVLVAKMRSLELDQNLPVPTIGDEPKRDGDYEAAMARFRESTEASLSNLKSCKQAYRDCLERMKVDMMKRQGAFYGVHGDEVLDWLRKLQRPDGSFGECLVDGQPYGSRDMRYCYMAAGVRWMLRRPDEQLPDIDVDKLREFILRGQTFDGGLAENSEHESHAGYAFCGVAALALLQRSPDGSPVGRNELQLEMANVNFDVGALERWLCKRASFLRDMEDDDDDDEDAEEPGRSTGADPTAGDDDQIGFNGRQNKVFDSCYTWWVCGALDILGRLDLCNRQQCLAFLLVQMQHQLAGGFGKHVNDRPDIYHSFLGLASCALLDPRDGGEVVLKPIDSALVIGRDAVRAIVAHRDSAYEPSLDNVSYETLMRLHQSKDSKNGNEKETGSGKELGGTYNPLASGGWPDWDILMASLVGDGGKKE